MKYTRDDYMSGKCTHSEYYGQYVNTAVRGFVLNVIGEKMLRGSTDKNFNDIPLVMWDRMHPYLVRFAPDNSLCASVCLAKEAARQIVRPS